MSELLAVPSLTHRCQVGWALKRLDDGRHVVVLTHEHDPVGTVLRCTECGKTWAAYRPYANVLVNSWRREGRIARWLRDRAERETT